ncbi:Fic/DOC family protein [Candidatus Soleaferrea massiliensis]|uniref:Fic/DOC family protein n=1 Tax=Candidatus Soleaferrea massiliensis TaxID=1470354 RepID=UPI00058D1DD1|nr:Fic family protein [Candidatus Soleaferrea massiliensis]
MSYEIEASSDSCYEGTTCFINKMDIRDEVELAETESALTLANISLLEQEPIEGNFDFTHYKAIHKFLFDDLYDWAGQIRTVNLSKKGTQFVPADEIEQIGNAIFARLAEADYFRQDDFDTFVKNITEFYCDTNLLHPFREGNGRTQRVFLMQLIRHAGYTIDFSNVDMDELMIATIHAANGVTDYVERIFRLAMRENEA